MNFDIHPIVVHFPIALLSLYSIIQIMPLHKWFPFISWKQIAQFLLVIGFAGTIIASGTGELASELGSPNHNLLELHELFAFLTQVFYGILAGAHVCMWIISQFNKLQQFRIVTIVMSIADFLLKKWVVVALSILGLVALTLTGVFGGAMVYGTSADPLARPLLQLFNVEP